MGNRKLPFGYHMELGKIVPHPPEAVLVKHVFQAYIAGESYNSLVEWLREQKIPYDVGRVWNKNMVARILEDRRYIGDKGYTFFTMGGARSHDMEYGVLNPYTPDFEEQYWTLRRMGASFRVNHRSWWKQELPSDLEYEEARNNLERVRHEVDYVITHCAPSSIVDQLGAGGYAHDPLTDYLEEVKERTRFHYWLFGHYHDNKILDDRFVLLWEQMIRVV